MIGFGILTPGHHLGRLYTLHRGASFHPNLGNSHNDNHYAHFEDLNGRWRLDRDDTAYAGGVWVSKCQTPSLNFIFRTPEQPYTINIALIYSSEHCRKSKRICLNCSGSKDHRVTTPIKNKIPDRTTCLLFKTPKIIKIGSRSSENGDVNIHRSAGGGPP